MVGLEFALAVISEAIAIHAFPLGSPLTGNGRVIGTYKMDDKCSWIIALTALSFATAHSWLLGPSFTLLLFISFCLLDVLTNTWFSLVLMVDILVVLTLLSRLIAIKRRCPTLRKPVSLLGRIFAAFSILITALMAIQLWLSFYAVSCYNWALFVKLGKVLTTSYAVCIRFSNY